MYLNKRLQEAVVIYTFQMQYGDALKPIEFKTECDMQRRLADFVKWQFPLLKEYYYLDEDLEFEIRVTEHNTEEDAVGITKRYFGVFAGAGLSKKFGEYYPEHII